MNHVFGKHYLLELIGCEAEVIADVASVESAMLAAARASNATILSQAFHQFDPHGVSGFLFIAESHFSIHTWPEAGYAAVDIFTCGVAMNADAALPVLRERLGAKRETVRIEARGF